MADNSPIEWTDATWNPITGCSVVSPGCTNCYAMKLAGTRLRHHPSRQGLTIDSKAGPVRDGQVRLNADWLTQPLKWRRPRRIFVCAHGDLFHESVPDEWIDQVFAVMALAPQHSFQVLTKRAERMRRYMDALSSGLVDRLFDTGLFASVSEGMFPFPLPNVWLGVSGEDQARADERIPELLATPAAVRFLSAEPLLGPIDLRGFIKRWSGAGNRTWESFTWPEWVPDTVRAEVEGFWNPAWGRGPDEWMRGARANGQPPLGAQGRYRRCITDEPFVDGLFVPAWNNIGRAIANSETYVVSAGDYQSRVPYLDWVIAGGESGPDARPMHPDWVRQIRDDCAATEVPFFFKQWGSWTPGENSGPFLARNPGAWFDDAGRPAIEVLTRREAEECTAETEPDVWRVAKKTAGRLLDGVEHNGMPG